MIISIMNEYGGWSWMVLGLALLILEIFAPGSFFIWFGVSALIVGLATFVLEGAVFWGWQGQLISFVVLSIILVIVGRRFMAKQKFDVSDAPHLNQRARQVVGREAVLVEAISQGVGRVKLGDTIWRVSGEDAPAGSKVKIVGEKSATMLLVESI